MEQWRLLPGSKITEISDAGRVRHARTKRVRRQSLSNNGYLKTNVTFGDRRKYAYVHQLVLLAFESARPKGHIARHINGDKTDNRLCNLEWSTRRQNALDVKWHAGNKGHRFSIEEVRCIKFWLQMGATDASLAVPFAVNESAIRRIRTGEHYPDV